MKRTPLKRKTPLHRYTPLRSYTPLRKIGKRGKTIRASERKLKKIDLSLLPVNEYGEKVCPHCLCKPDFRGWCFIHIKSKGSGGDTTESNTWTGCFRCHNSRDKSIGGHDHHEKFAKPCWSKKS